MRYRTPFLASLTPLAALFLYAALGTTAAPDKLAAAPKANYECRWTDTPVALDGKDDDAAWKNAPVIETFGQTWLGEKSKVRGKTRAKVLWDRDYFYFYAELDDADLMAKVKEHDGAIWEDDCFEFFFKPAADKTGYYEFEVNPLNAIFDAYYPKRDFAQIEKWIKQGDFKLETKVQLRGTLNKHDDTDKGWSVEGRMPWTDYLRTGGRPMPGEQWHFSLCRGNYDKDKPIELTTIAATEKNKIGAFFHQYEDYPTLTFVGTSPVPPSLASRAEITTSTVVGSPEPPPPYRVKRLYPNYTPTNPILAKAVPGTDQLLVIHENAPWGVAEISRLKDDPAVKTADMVKLLDTPKGGLAYDFCFHPKFAENHYIYVGWNGPNEKGKVKKKACRITRYTMKLKPEVTIDRDSAKTIIEWESDGHNGHAVTFGLDGMLYVTSGDGTSDSDTDDKGQSTDTLLSKLMRLDVDHPDEGKAYSVPKDNPFVNDKRFRPETYAYGFRNPWRICCDEKTGHIWVGNNGQDLWETAYLVKPGDNFGWSVTEGSHPFYEKRKPGPTPITKPTIEHHHSEFRSLTGGLVYYGKQFPDLNGAYLYADYSTGRIWGMKHDGKNVIWHKELATPRMGVTGFGTNTRGELIICDHAPTGGLFTLEPTPKDDKPSIFPRKLSDSGLYDSVKDHRMKAGAFPYSVNAPFWSDGLHKERWIVLPPGEQITYGGNRGWNCPDKTVLVKSFAIEQEEGNAKSRKWIETRFLTKQDGEWYGYTYLWNEAGTDAELVPSAGLDKTFAVKTATGKRDQTWHYPSRTECMACHSRAANFTLGLCEVQMNKTIDTDGVKANQLSVMDQLGMFKHGANWAERAKAEIVNRAKAKKLTGKDAEEYEKLHGPQEGQRPLPGRQPSFSLTPEKSPRLVDPFDAKEDLTKRAKSWLHANCSQCHVEAGGGNAQMNLDFHMALDKMKILDEKPIHTTLDLADAKLIAAGDPDRSVLLKRMGRRGKDQMPPLSTSSVDTAGEALLREWVKSLKK